MTQLMNDLHVADWGLHNISQDWYALDDRGTLFNICDYEAGKGVVVYSKILPDISLLKNISKMLRDLNEQYHFKICLLWVEQDLDENIKVETKEGKDVVVFDASLPKPCCDIYMNIQDIKTI